MEPKFSQGDRVVICNEKAAADMQVASRTGAIVQADADDGPEGTFHVMFDGEDLPQWVTGASLRRA